MEKRLNEINARKMVSIHAPRAGRDCHLGTLEKSCILKHDFANLENRLLKLFSYFL